jgi:hypothetical protein
MRSSSRRATASATRKQASVRARFGADCASAICRRGSIEPDHQRILQGRGTRQRRQRGSQDIGIIPLAHHQAGFGQGLGQFLDEQRHALGLGDDLLQYLPGSGVPATRSILAIA